MTTARESLRWQELTTRHFAAALLPNGKNAIHHQCILHPRLISLISSIENRRRQSFPKSTPTQVNVANVICVLTLSAKFTRNDPSVARYPVEEVNVAAVSIIGRFFNEMVHKGLRNTRATTLQQLMPVGRLPNTTIRSRSLNCYYCPKLQKH